MVGQVDCEYPETPWFAVDFDQASLTVTVFGGAVVVRTYDGVQLLDIPLGVAEAQVMALLRRIAFGFGMMTLEVV